MMHGKVERESLERLFEEYYDQVYIYIARRVNNRSDAENLTSDVFLKAFSHPYDPQLAKFSTYVYAIAANALKNYYRFTAAHSKIMILDEPDENFSDETDLLRDLITREEYADLQAALARLPERQYEAVFRRYYLNESFKEIGAALSTSEPNARKLHFEAIKKLKKILKHPNEIATRVYTQTKGDEKLM